MDELKFWKNIFNLVNKGKKLVLVIVGESSFSSPGKQGFKMLVDENANIYGTIGGGIMEKEMIEYSLDFLFGNEKKSIKKLFHNPNTKYESSGLICGGNQTVLFKIITENEINVVREIVANISRNNGGMLEVTKNTINFEHRSSNKKIEFVKEGDNWLYRELIGERNTIYIAGGGHVGLAVSKIMKELGFYIKIFDHREDVFTLVQNGFADEKILVKNYYEFGNYVKEGEKSFVVIVTSKHFGDKEALQSVINKKIKYIGMMGSKKKIVTIFNALKKEGIEPKEFEKIHSPIGLEIEAETPEEIAISIAAEIIKVKNTSIN